MKPVFIEVPPRSTTQEAALIRVSQISHIFPSINGTTICLGDDGNNFIATSLPYDVLRSVLNVEGPIASISTTTATDEAGKFSVKYYTAKQTEEQSSGNLGFSAFDVPLPTKKDSFE